MLRCQIGVLTVASACAGPSKFRYISSHVSRRHVSSSSSSSSSRSPISESSLGTDGWETVIGLEIHAQIRTGRKLFSRAKLRHDESPNTHVALLDAAFPGVLPVIDPEAIKLSLLTALALGCNINPRSTFDRKHYFYHDIPLSYQITQHYNPIAKMGKLKLSPGDNGVKRAFEVGIIQLQMEQDTAKSQTVGGEVLVDLNRAGAGLMEIVTAPDMRSSEEAGAFVKRLQSLLRRVGSGDGDMEKGNLRVDANVSVRKPGQPFGTRCEIKNVNSVRFLQQAIEAERRRHINHYETVSTPLRQETRSLNELTGETYTLRTKEDAEDYRYMPDPNLPAMAIDPNYLETLRASVPEMPWETVDRVVAEYGVERRDVETLIGLDEYTVRGVTYFEKVVGNNLQSGRKVSNWINHEILGQLKKVGKVWSPDIVPADLLRNIVTAVESGEITGSTGRAVIKHVISASGFSPLSGSTSLSSLLAHLGLTPTSAPDLTETCRAAIAKLPKEAEAVRQGNEKVAMRLVGEVMKLSKGAADAKMAREVILNLLRAPVV